MHYRMNGYWICVRVALRQQETTCLGEDSDSMQVPRQAAPRLPTRQTLECISSSPVGRTAAGAGKASTTVQAPECTTECQSIAQTAIGRGGHLVRVPLIAVRIARLTKQVLEELPCGVSRLEP